MLDDKDEFEREEFDYVGAIKQAFEEHPFEIIWAFKWEFLTVVSLWALFWGLYHT